LSFIVRLGAARCSPARSFDYVIVGAGSAGCVVARRLLDGADATVLLLEAGGSDEGVASISNPPQWLENIGSPYDWAYRYEPSPHVAHRSIPLPLGKVLGGSGSVNGLSRAPTSSSPAALLSSLQAPHGRHTGVVPDAHKNLLTGRKSLQESGRRPPYHCPGAGRLGVVAPRARAE
jgi:GMC oxidoreductase